DKNISVDMIIQNVSKEAQHRADVTFTLGKSDLARAKPFIEEVGKRIGATEVRYDEEIVKVSIVGLGMRSHAGIAAKMFRIMAAEG
ncbi:aspartate kinase, partial [Salmonella enterica subsp. enterica serovar Enteritidis]|uniref:ACT domain-containing protein n=1 Tax=Salmonella enterica TaxID=28901 RepID=UPI0019BBA8FE|nr:aspartate kinase [Salmonella enterica subsp. enterica serovar Enteritidis]